VKFFIGPQQQLSQQLPPVDAEHQFNGLLGHEPGPYVLKIATIVAILRTYASGVSEERRNGV
jgi:hypothetical protein